jgi:Domain of Unknown Function with PDB structure (DUF3857)
LHTGHKLLCEAIVSLRYLFLRILTTLALTLAAQVSSAQAPDAAQKPADKKAGTATSAEPQLPAQIELLETHVRFETNGDSRKEVHTRVRINNELGVQQFARLNFNFNRSFESIEIPFVRITHASGGTVDILPSAITDNPNPAVVNFPAYQDVRVKSVRILGLEPGDLLEYRVITTVSHHPLAPDFWLNHTFDRSGVVARENFEIDLPASRNADSQSIESSLPQALGNGGNPSLARVHVSPQTPKPSFETLGEGDAARAVYRWQISPANFSNQAGDISAETTETDVAVSTFVSWGSMAFRIVPHFSPYGRHDNDFIKKSYKLQPAAPAAIPFIPLYDFVSQEIRTVDLPLGATGFALRDPWEVLSTGYGTPEDKVRLFSALSRWLYRTYFVVLTAKTEVSKDRLPEPTAFNHILVQVPDDVSKTSYFLDPSLEIAPFGEVPAEFRKKTALRLLESYSWEEKDWWVDVPDALPFPAKQHVGVDARLAADGSLTTKVKYTMRGDNELLLRVAFHQSPKEKWKDLAQLLAISDGFRGKVTNVNASDPYDTHEPFTVEYEITMPKFVDWSKKPVRIPALLPQVALPDPPAKPAPGAATSPIELGTPLDVETHVTLQLPAGTTARVPTGSSVERDYVIFSSKYSANGLTLTASRHINFLLREVPAARIADYNAFLRAVQNDQAQDFTLERTESSPAKTQPAADKPTPPNKP